MPITKLKPLEGVTGVYHPEDWSAEQIAYLRQAHEAGVRQGIASVRDPMIKLLGIDTLLFEIEERLEEKLQSL